MDAEPERSETVGFIGLGNIGTPIAERLLAAGTPLVVHDARAKAMTALIDAGADASARALPNSRSNAARCWCACRPTSSAARS